MYVHIGQDYMIPARSIVAVFDMDTATAAPRTRATLARLEEEGRVVTVFDDLPRAGILCQTAFGEILYLTGLSTAALARRVRAGLGALQLIDGKGTKNYARKTDARNNAGARPGTGRGARPQGHRDL